MNAAFQDPSMLALILLLGVLATEPWRWMGVLFSGNLNADSELIKWVRAVSTALIAALVVRLLLAPPGTLAQTPDLARLLSLAISVAVYFATNRKLLVAIGAGVISFIIMLELNVF